MVMFEPGRRLSVIFVAAAMALAGCSSSSPSGSARDNNSGATGGASESKAGTSYDVDLASNVDGENIAFTVHEPDQLEAGQSYPLILHSHGYGGSRISSRPTSGFGASLLANGYGLLSLDERGHGDSGGLIRILDPDFEGQDWLQVLDWTEANLEWMRFETGDDGAPNPVMGSYGGGFQHLIYRIDPKLRLDALIPDITWYDLRYSLFSGNVFKTYWAGLLSAGGNVLANGQDPEVNEGLAQGVLLNTLDDGKLDLLYRHSLISACEAGTLTPIDAFYTQSALDTLFNYNEAVWNYDCVRALGGDVRIWIKPAGHSGGDHSDCGSINIDDARLAWFDEKLYGESGAADFIPQQCINFGSGGDDAIIVSDISGKSNPAPITIAQQQMLLEEGLDQTVGPTNVELITVGEGGQVMAGLPGIELTMLDPVLGEAGAGDPILFVAIGRSTDGGASYTPVMDQFRPFRGYGTHVAELNGIATRLDAGDKVALMLFPSQSSQYPTSGSSAAAPVTIDATVTLPLIGTGQPSP